MNANVSNPERVTPPLLILGACKRCGASGAWIERYATYNGYSHLTIDFTMDGDVSAWNESGADVDWSSGETQELRCCECGMELGEAQVKAIAVLEGATS